MANKPFKDITDRDLFAGLVMAALSASEPDKPMSDHASRRPSHRGAQGADRQAALEHQRGRQQDDIDDRNA